MAAFSENSNNVASKREEEILQTQPPSTPTELLRLFGKILLNEYKKAIGHGSATTRLNSISSACKAWIDIYKTAQSDSIDDLKNEIDEIKQTISRREFKAV